MKEYKIKEMENGEIVAYARNGRAWVPMYAGFPSEGRDLMAHFSAVLEGKGYASVMGRKGGQATSEAKAAAARENGKKGGKRK